MISLGDTVMLIDGDGWATVEYLKEKEWKVKTKRSNGMLILSDGELEITSHVEDVALLAAVCKSCLGEGCPDCGGKA